MKKRYHKKGTGIIGTFGISGITAYMTGVIQGYIRGFAGEHRIVKRGESLLLPVAAFVLVFLVVYLTVPILPQIKREAEDASVAQAAGEEQKLIVVDCKAPVIRINLKNKKGWCQKNTIFVSAEDSLSVEYRYICAASRADSGWSTESSKDVYVNGTWMIQVRDAAGNMAEQEIVIDNIDTQAPVIRSITEKEGEAVKNEE